MLSLLTLLVGHFVVELVGHFVVELVGHQGRRLVWLRRTNGGGMQLEVLGAVTIDRGAKQT